MICAMAASSEQLLKWSGLVGSKIRILISQLENNKAFQEGTNMFKSNMSQSELLNLHSLLFYAQCLVYRKNLAEYLPPSEMKQIRKKRSSVQAESSSPDGVTTAGDRKREGGDREPEGE